VNSWDRFTIPKWGSRVAVVYEPPIYVARDASDEDLKDAHKRFRTALLSAERRGFEYLGVRPDWPEEEFAEHWDPYQDVAKRASGAAH
jgi:hypothetical protein